MDAISVFGAGVRNVVASLGTAFTVEHCQKLLRYAPNIYFCYDSDEAGQKATIRALSIVRDTGAVVRVIVVPDGKDPDEYIRKHGADAFRALVKEALPLVEYRLQYVLKHVNYDTLDGKVRALHEMLPVLAGIRETAVRSEYEKKLAQIQETATELFRGEVVAKVGDHKLFRSQLDQYIPSGVSAEDSAGLAQQYIHAWAEDLLLLDMAEEQLSEAEKDVSRELEEYRQTLLKYRYEQLYIDQRLDTLITDAEIDRYYKENSDRFRLDRPVVKARYMIIPADARSLKTLRKQIASDDDSEVAQADSLASTVALKYVDASDTWMDVITLAQELGTDYRSLLGAIKHQMAELPDDAGNLRIAYIVEMVPEGKTAPLEYCTQRIRDLILSARKHQVEVSLEASLLEDARKNNKFVIY